MTQSSQWQINSSVYLFCFSVLTGVITQGFFILFWLRKAVYGWFTSSCLMLNPRSLEGASGSGQSPLAVCSLAGLCSPVCIYPAGQPAEINNKTPRCDGHTSLFAALHLPFLVFFFFLFWSLLLVFSPFIQRTCSSFWVWVQSVLSFALWSSVKACGTLTVYVDLFVSFWFIPKQKK